MRHQILTAIVLFIILLTSINSALALADPTVLFAPSQVFETKSASFSINLSNFRGAYGIQHVQALTPGFRVVDVVDYMGWTEHINGSFAEWRDGSIANNVVLAVFEFLASAPKVESDAEFEATITLIDDEDVSHEFSFPLAILNDNTSAILENILPLDDALVKEGTTNYAIRVNATDPETGIDNVTFSWVRCNFEENITPEEHTLQLAQTGGLYQNTVDLSDYEDENEVCFEFEAYNNGGDRSAYSGSLVIDGVPPSVTLVSPVDGAIIGLSRNFSFFAADNLAQEVECSMYIDGTSYLEDIEAQFMDIVFIPSADVEEGEHTWQMKCVDPAGWLGESTVWSYNLDKTPPQINMTSPENNSIISEPTLLEFEVTDNYDLNRVWFVHDGNTTEVSGVFSIDVTDWPEGPSEFAVRARDSVGNQAEQTYRVIVDRTPPVVSLVSPENNDSIDVHVNFTYSVLDNYDAELNCKVYIDDTGYEQHTAANGGQNSWSKLLALGAYRWKVQCVDDAGNSGTSDEKSFNVVDMTGPDISMEIPDVVFRGDPVSISLEVTDISGVGSVTATLIDPDGNTQNVPLENIADQYTASIATTTNSITGTYTLEVSAVDTLNNFNTLSGNYDLEYVYVIVFDLAPSTTIPSAVVEANGLVLYDNGSSVPETYLTVSIPLNETRDVSLNGSAFAFSFAAPSSDGVYNVTAYIESAANGREYNKTKQLTISTPGQGGSGGGGGGGGGGSDSDEEDPEQECESDWSCTAWTSCSGGRQSRTCYDRNGCGDDSRRSEQKSCSDKKKTKTESDTESNKNSGYNAGRESPAANANEESIVVEDDDLKGKSAGIGKATGFMNLLEDNGSMVFFASLLVAVLAGLYKYGWGKIKKKTFSAVDVLSTKGDKLGLEAYLDERSVKHRDF
jgi:hypothetical protein